jgi:aminopeptidase N
VLDAIAQVIGQPHAISVAEVEAALEDTTGADLSHYFDVWVHGSGAPTWPRFAITTADAGGGALDVTITQVSPTDKLYGCAFDVRLFGATADEQLDVPFDLGPDGMATATATVTPTFTVTSTLLDPFATCLAYPGTAALGENRHAPGWTPWHQQTSDL